MTLSLDIIQTLGLAVLLYLLGVAIRNKFTVLKKYFIPAPVIGGLIFSILALIATQQFGFTFELNTSLQDFFMNLFFTTVGFTISFKLIAKSGKQGIVLAIVAIVLLFIQNIVGVGLSKVFGIHELLGVAMGSTSMSGGVGSAGAFGPTFELNGAAGATTIGIAAATFGLMMGSLVGGPVAKRLIDRYDLKSDYVKEDGSLANDKSFTTEDGKLMNTIIVILLAAAGGTFISYLLSLTGLTFPYYVGCLFGGAVARNIADTGAFNIRMKEINAIGNVSLNLFLSLALMSLDIMKLVDLAIPMIVILLTQTVVMILYAYFVTFRAMGKTYDAAVMAAGHCGVGLGQTPNAIANMSAVIEENGPAPNAWFVLPVITVVFINLANPIVINLFITMFGT